MTEQDQTTSARHEPKDVETPILELRGLKKHFPIRGRKVMRAVDGLSLSVHHGETVSLVGESGCGKSTTGKVAIGLLDPTEGSVLFRGRDVSSLSSEELGSFRRDVQIVFQDPFGSLNPRMTVGSMLEEVLKVHKLAGDAAGRRRRIEEILGLVGLSPTYAGRYPHEFSGGQRQRIGIARALCVEPSLIICDEPVSALDVSVQAQVVNLLQDLQNKLGLAYLFIAHDLAVVRQVSHRVAVMYLGRIVEQASVERIYVSPEHPYTQALLSAVPSLDAARGGKSQRIILSGDLQSEAADLPSGCPFFPRCPHPEKDSACQRDVPLLEFKEMGHGVACHKASSSSESGHSGRT